MPTQQDNERGRDLHCEPSPASKLMAGCYVAGWLVYLERLFCVTVFVYPAGGRKFERNCAGSGCHQGVCVCGYPSAVVWRVRVHVIAALAFERVCVFVLMWVSVPVLVCADAPPTYSSQACRPNSQTR